MMALVYGMAVEHLLLVAILALMGFEMLGASTRVVRIFVAIVLVAACLILLKQYAAGSEIVLASGEIRSGPFAALAKLVLLGCALLLHVSMGTARTPLSSMLLCASLFGAMLVLDSGGFISLFIGLEMVSLPAFALMVHGAGSATAGEGALKYLLLSSVASAVVLFGIAFAYGASGSLRLDAYALASDASPGFATAGALIASAFLLKAAVFPFHGWAPDAYQGARLGVTAFLASIVKAAVVLAMLRVFGTGPLHPAVAAPLILLAIASVAYGNVAALRQRTFKRLLAYSSIAHAGYMMIAFCGDTGERAADLLWYVGIYAASVVVACATFASLCGEDEALERLDGAFQRRPGTALLFGLAMLSLAGLPPLPGFFAKVLVFRSAMASGHLVAATTALLASYIGVAYYFRLFVRVFAANGRALAPSGSVAP